jgi:hypothetical protein
LKKGKKVEIKGRVRKNEVGDSETKAEGLEGGYEVK